MKSKIILSLVLLVLSIFSYVLWLGLHENEQKQAAANYPSQVTEFTADEAETKAIQRDQALDMNQEMAASVVGLENQFGNILAIANPEERYRAFDEFLSQLNADNAHQIRMLIEQTFPPTMQNKAVYELLLHHWAKIDGPNAVTYAMQSLKDDLRLDGGVAATRSWAETDIEVAADYVSDLPNAYGKDYIVYDLVFPYIETDPVAAMRWVHALPDAFKETAARHAMEYWLSRDPEAATDWVIQNSDSLPETRSISEAAIHWTRQDLAQADRFVERLNSHEAKTVAMEAIVDWLASEQPVVVADWLNQYADSPLLDRTLAQFAKSISEVDSSSARSWANSITDAELRLATLSEIDRRSGEMGMLSRPKVMVHKGDLIR